MKVFTLSRNDSAHPGKLVVRESEIDADGFKTKPEPIYIGESLDEAHAAIRVSYPGATPLTNGNGDVEVWL